MGRRDAAASAAPPLRKGPWMAEEDAVLVEYVRKQGPRNWSSIRHRGLLPRSGKSCRLRWVNKLKPDLKTGCKFSPEEERVVIELQAQFGNKWARIATYLPGRTDNDVKNFWSTRQKRLARLLLAQSKGAANSQGKTPAAFRHDHPIPPFLQETAHSSWGPAGAGEEYCSEQERRRLEPVLNFEGAGHGVVAVPSDQPCSSERKQHLIPSNPPPPHFSFLQLPEALLDLPLLPETHHLATDFDGVDFDQEYYTLAGVPEFDLLTDGLPYPADMGYRSLGGVIKVEEEEMVPAGPDGFFGDFPLDMLDSLNPPASSSRP